MAHNQTDAPTNTVMIRRLRTEHGGNGFAEFVPLGPDMVQEVRACVAEIFDALGGASLLKPGGDVFIKPNGVGADPYVHTRPEVLEAAVRYWFAAGARRVYVMENSSQGNYTRLVFEMIGYNALCRRTGAVPVYLDEHKTVPFTFQGKGPRSDSTPRGYERTTFGMPDIVARRLVREKDQNLYVSIPKLKTHTLSGISLGIKNQWGFPAHADRSPDHNFNLHSKIVDLLDFLRPDVTLIDGLEGTIHGHYPLRCLADQCVRPFRILAGGLNVVAVDIAGAAVFGMDVQDVPHLALAVQRGHGRGVTCADDIHVAGDFPTLRALDILGELPKFNGKYPSENLPILPGDVTIIKGADRACTEGCYGNSLGILQYLSKDYGGKGGWTLVTGKGLDPDALGAVAGPVLVVGPCAVRETGDALVRRLGKRRVYFSRECNDITASIEAMVHLMKVNMFQYASRTSLHPVKALALILHARWNRSHGRQVNPASVLFKLR